MFGITSDSVLRCPTSTCGEVKYLRINAEFNCWNTDWLNVTNTTLNCRGNYSSCLPCWSCPLCDDLQRDWTRSTTAVSPFRCWVWAWTNRRTDGCRTARTTDSCLARQTSIIKPGVTWLAARDAVTSPDCSRRSVAESHVVGNLVIACCARVWIRPDAYLKPRSHYYEAITVYVYVRCRKVIRYELVAEICGSWNFASASAHGFLPEIRVRIRCNMQS